MIQSWKTLWDEKPNRGRDLHFMGWQTPRKPISYLHQTVAAQIYQLRWNISNWVVHFILFIQWWIQMRNSHLECLFWRWVIRTNCLPINVPTWAHNISSKFICEIIRGRWLRIYLCDTENYFFPSFSAVLI